MFRVRKRALLATCLFFMILSGALQDSGVRTASGQTPLVQEFYYIVYFKGYKNYANIPPDLKRRLLFEWYVPHWGFLESLTAAEAAHIENNFKDWVCGVRQLSKEDVVSLSLREWIETSWEGVKVNDCAAAAGLPSVGNASCDNLAVRRMPPDRPAYERESYRRRGERAEQRVVPDPVIELSLRLGEPKTVEDVRGELVALLTPKAPDSVREVIERVVDRAVYGPAGETEQVIVNLRYLVAGVERVLPPKGPAALEAPEQERQPERRPRTTSTDSVRLEAEQVRVRSTVLDALIEALPEKRILRVDPREYATLRNGTTSWVIQSNRRDERIVFDHDLRGKGEVIGLIDDFLDLEHCFLEGGTITGQKHRKVVRSRANAGGRASRHGTFVAGILAGARGDAPTDVNNGQAPGARIGFASVWDFSAPGHLRKTLSDTLSALYDDIAANKSGARIFSNSWGNDQSCCYTDQAFEIDAFTWEHEDALVVFGVSNGERVMSPENAKNVLAVGASKQAEMHGVKGSGGRGPTLDGRRKPEIFAPGCRIQSALFGTECDLAGAPVFRDPRAVPPTRDTLFENVSRFFGRLPYAATQKPFVAARHNTDCATSWAAPAVAGAAALVRQYYKDGLHLGNTRMPSGALLKATLLNGTVDMQGTADEYGNKYPNDIEGWGRLLLDEVLLLQREAGWRRLMAWDVKQADSQSFKRPAWPPETRYHYINAWHAREPLKITLVWTEPPPAPFVRDYPVVNDLNLKVVPLGWPPGWHFYLGNDFNQHGFTRLRRRYEVVETDSRNNVEQVVIPNPYGRYRIEVQGKEIWVVPPPAGGLPRGQGYAVVVTGGIN